MRRGNESNVGALRAVAAQALVLALLQHAQQLGLHDERQLADLVEEERATARGLDAPRTGPIGPGERAALMAEELALQQLALEHSAVDGDEGLLAARALLVDRARHDLLAGARFAEQQHGGRAWCNALHRLGHAGHRRVAAAHPQVLAAELLAQAAHLGLQATRFERPAHHQLDRRRVERLGDKVVGPRAHRAHRAIHVAVRGDDDHQRRAGRSTQVVEDRKAVHARHFQIEQQQVGGLGRAQGFDAVDHMLDLVAEFLQPVAEDASDAAVVIRNDNAAQVGNLSTNRLPVSARGSNTISPPCSRARLRAIARPSPLPAVPSAVRQRKKRSKR